MVTKLTVSGDSSLRLQAGETYVVTDPCYVFGSHDWGRFCDEVFFKESQGVFTFGRSAPVLFSRTAFGDGCYSVNHGDVSLGEFGVDAGLFCVIRKKDAIKHGGVDFAGMAGVCEFVSTGGVISVENCGIAGEINCVTDGSDDDEEDEDWEEDDDECDITDDDDDFEDE